MENNVKKIFTLIDLTKIAVIPITDSNANCYDCDSGDSCDGDGGCDGGGCDGGD